MMKLTIQVLNQTFEEKQKSLVRTGKTQEAQIIELLNKLQAVGVSEVNFTGGELFALNKAHDVLKTCSANHMKTAVTTSVDCMTPEKFDLVKSDLNKIIFKLDYENNRKQPYREETYLARLVKMIEHINCVAPGFPIDVKSVVCQENLCYLLGMARELELLHVNQWNLHEYRPLRGNQFEDNSKTTLTADTFQNVVSFLRNRSSLRIEDFPKDRIETKLIVSPNDELRYSVGGKEKIILANLSNQPVRHISKMVSDLTPIGAKLKNCTIKPEKVNPIEIL